MTGMQQKISTYEKKNITNPHVDSEPRDAPDVGAKEKGFQNSRLYVFTREIGALKNKLGSVFAMG